MGLTTANKTSNMVLFLNFLVQRNYFTEQAIPEHFFNNLLEPLTIPRCYRKVPVQLNL